MHIIQRFALPPFQSRSFIARYAVAIASVLAVLVLRSSLHPFLGTRSQFIVFLLAVLVTAWYSGTIPALFALALGAFMGNIFFDAPYFTLKLDNTSDTIAMLFYLLVGVVIVYLFEVVKRHEARLTDQIAKQAAVENALRLSEERFRLATEALAGVIYDWDASTDVAYRSPGLFEILGYQLDEITNNRKWWQAQIHPDDFERVQQAHQKSIAQRAPTHSVEYRVRHKDGHYLWVWDNSRIIYNTQGLPIRLIGNTFSIDDRKRLAESLTQVEERFRAAFENASDAMALSDEQAVVVAANQAYLQLYGYSAEEVVGHNYAIIYPEEAREQSFARYQQVFNNLDELPISDSVVQRKDGTRRIVEARIGFVTQHGRRTHMLSVIRDLTERKQAEKEIFVRYQLTADLAHAVTVEDVGRVTVEHLMQYLGAIAGNVYIYHARDNVIEMLYSKADMTPQERELLLRFPADSSYPMGDVVKHHRPLLFSSFEERIAAYPLTEQFSHEAPGALMVLPLVVASEVFGVISIMFLDSRTFAESEQTFISSLVFQCAQAIERARLADQASELAVMHERQRLARDLHDNVSQLLFSSSVISEMLPRLWGKQPEKASRMADQLNLMVRGAMAEMRTLLWELRPESIVQTQLSSLLTQLAYAVRARQETEISVTVRAENEYTLPPDVQVGFYRIAQESVHNVVKHGRAAAISILMRQTDKYTALMVIDDGQGFDTTAVGAGFGLRNMQERAANIGAQFSIKSQIGKGTRMRLLWMTPTTSNTDQLEINLK